MIKTRKRTKLSKMIAILLIMALSVACLSVTAFATNSSDSKNNTLVSADEKYVLGNKITIEEINKKANAKSITELKWLSGYDYFNWLTSTDFSQYYQGATNTNCVPTAIANVFSYFDANGVNMFYGNFTQSMYDNLCQLLQYNVYSGTAWNKQKPAIISFASQYGRTAVVDNYWFNLWSDIKRDINANKPIILSVASGNYGHVSMIVGYYVEDGVKKVICLSGYTTPYLTEYVYNNSTFTMQSVYIS